MQGVAIGDRSLIAQELLVTNYAMVGVILQFIIFIRYRFPPSEIEQLLEFK